MPGVMVCFTFHRTLSLFIRMELITKNALVLNTNFVEKGARSRKQNHFTFTNCFSWIFPTDTELAKNIRMTTNECE